MENPRGEPGDLVFRYRGTSDFAGAVGAVVTGWGGLAVYHVALVEGDGWAWEAGRDGVRRVRPETWDGGRLLGRLASRWRSVPGLVEGALAWVRDREGLPYNDCFDQSKTSFYCSELVVDAFRAAGSMVFSETPLSFRDPQTGRLVDYWVKYYADRGLPVPEGQPGSHPAHLSLSPEVTMELWG